METTELNVGDWVKSISDKIVFVGKIKELHEIPNMEGSTSLTYGTTYIVKVQYSGFYSELVWLSGELEKITEEEAMIELLRGANSE